MSQSESTTHEEAGEARLLMRTAGWRRFEQFLRSRGEDKSVRIAYDRGVIELLSPSTEHENDVIDITTLIATFSEEMEVELTGAGGPTIKDVDVERGVEPDASFFVGRRRRGPPDIVLEVIWTRPLLDKLAIFHSLGIREVWVWKRSSGFEVYRRGRARFVRAERSTLVPALDHALLAKYVGNDSSLKG